jgi:peptide deformylase
MSILDIVKYPDPILTTPTDYISQAQILSSEVQTLIENMMDTCAYAGGVGLSANQVGSHHSICIYIEPGQSMFKVLINPFIVEKGGGLLHSKGEGCLSVPGKFFNIFRYKKLTVEGLDRDGNQVIIETKSKRLAKVLQHEIDHLSGIIIAKKGKKP